MKSKLARGSGRQPMITINAVAHSAGCHYFLDYQLGFRCAPPRLYAIARYRGLTRTVSLLRLWPG
jgi:hypothetical protein